MNLKKLKSKFFLIVFCKLVECNVLEKRELMQKDQPLHYFFMSIGGIVLLIVSIVAYWQSLQEEKRVEFTVFNSQYIDK